MKPLLYSLQERLRLLESKEPERAFAPDPGSDCWKISEGGNTDAVESVKASGLRLVHVASGEIRDLQYFSSGLVIFATTWEPFSAKTLGTLKVMVEMGEVERFGLVLFEHNREEVIARKSSAWYFNSAYVLAPESEKLRTLVREVPLRLFVGSSGSIEGVLGGKA